MLNKEGAIVILITGSQLTIADLVITMAGDHSKHEVCSWDHRAHPHGGHK